MGDNGRKTRLLEMLRDAAEPVPGAQLSSRLGVSRQAVVQDIAVLRSGGQQILATSRGYLLASSLRPSLHRAEIVVCHSPEHTAEELYSIVDLGVTVVDVAVEHAVYGEIRGGLQFSSRADVAEFLAKVGPGRAHLLSELTDGRHLHTLEASTPELLDRVRAELDRLGILLHSE
ncbi:MAG: transcription repressor NadR [Chloroflexota bacterium]|nr:transcription repressor NadR [Chloroflexota bacterium]